ncbi:hypothetical protein PYCC9005_001022 [Savitreella phatthalungensis]
MTTIGPATLHDSNLSSTAAYAEEDLEVLAAALRSAVHRKDDASDSDSSIGDAPSNRFNKLKRKARFRSKAKLDSAGGIKANTTQYFHGSRRRAIIGARRSNGKRLKQAELFLAGSDAATLGAQHQDDDVMSSGDDEDDPYTRVAVDELLAPLSSTSDLPHHPALAQTFKRQAVSVLASQALETIATEHEHRVQLSRLLTAFLGDDPVLIMRHYEGDIKGTSLRDTPTEVALKSGPNSIILPMGSDSIPSARAVTRGAVVAEETSLIAHDFAAPEYDRNLGMGSDEAEEARRLLQAALDRSEEYLRCMQRARMGLLKADRYKQTAWRWCQDALKARNGELGHGHMHV